MESTGPATGREPDRGTPLPPRLWRVLGVALIQIAAAVAVFALSWIPASLAESDGPDDWAGFEYLIMGVVAAPFAAVLAGLIAAARLRLPFYGLYVFPVPVSAVAMAAAQASPLVIGVLVLLAATALVGAATARFPLRGRPRRRVPF